MSDEQHPTLDDAARRRLFGVAAIAVVLATIGVALIPRSEPSRPARPAHAPGRAGAANVVGGAPAKRAAPPAPLLMQDIAARDVRRALATARRFVRAYLRFEAGAANDRIRRALRRTATPTFAARLLEDPPRIPPHGVQAGTLQRIDPADDPNAHAISVAAMIEREGVVRSVPIRMRRVDGAWRVHALG